MEQTIGSCRLSPAAPREFRIYPRPQGRPPLIQSQLHDHTGVVRRIRWRHSGPGRRDYGGSAAGPDRQQAASENEIDSLVRVCRSAVLILAEERPGVARIVRMRGVPGIRITRGHDLLGDAGVFRPDLRVGVESPATPPACQREPGSKELISLRNLYLLGLRYAGDGTLQVRVHEAELRPVDGYIHRQPPARHGNLPQHGAAEIENRLVTIVRALTRSNCDCG